MTISSAIQKEGDLALSIVLILVGIVTVLIGIYSHPLVKAAVLAWELSP